MTTWTQKFLTWLQDPRNRSRFIAGVIGVFVLVGVVFFSSQIDNLLSLFGSRAAITSDDLAKEWDQVEASGGKKRAHAKLVVVEQDNQDWLYVAGGIDVFHSVVEQRNQAKLVNSVQRIELDPQTGEVAGGAAWEDVASLNFGHAEFGFIQKDNYLYVISGDIHTPPEEEGKTPLLYSTIERLNLNETGAGWEVFALLTGVNFYPEVTVASGGIHVVGGIYGNPFPPLPGMDEEDQIQDLLDLGSGLWGELDLGSKPVIGNVGHQSDGKVSPSIPYGVINSVITQGVVTSPSEGEIEGPSEDKPSLTGVEPTNLTISGISAALAQAGNFNVEFTHPTSDDVVQAVENYTVQWTGDPTVALYFREGVWADWKLVHSNAGGGWGPGNRFVWDAGYLSGGGYYAGPTVPDAQLKACWTGLLSQDPVRFSPDCSRGQALSEPFKFVQEFWIDDLKTNLGLQLDNGWPVTITWDYHGKNARVELEYRVVGTSSWQLIKSDILASDKKYKWYTPNVTTGGDVTVEIRASISPPEYRFTPNYLLHPSGYEPGGTDTVNLTIRDSGGNWIEILSPAGGEVWEPGSAHDIRWHSNVYSGSVVLYYTLNGDLASPVWSYIGTVPVGDRSYEWSILGTLPYTDGARIKAVIGAAEDISEEFSIKSSVELASVLSEGLIKGTFVTTVGEHFIINTNNPALSQAGELNGLNQDKDYIGTLSDKWEVGKVAHLGHLRFLITGGTDRYTTTGNGYSVTDEASSYDVVPVPQGRYGHRLVIHESRLHVFGGASWAKEIVIANREYSAIVAYDPRFGPPVMVEDFMLIQTYEYRLKSFWVIDDAIHPFYQVTYSGGTSYPPGFDFGKSNYQFIGNITYRYNTGTSWSGTYSNSNLGGLAFKSDGGVKQGRAFFGMASSQPGASTWVAAGGLRNDEVASLDDYKTSAKAFWASYPENPNYDARIIFYSIPVSASADTEVWADSQWQRDQDLLYGSAASPEGKALYNLAAFGLEGGVLTYSGQGAFQVERFSSSSSPTMSHPFVLHDPHVPDYGHSFDASEGLDFTFDRHTTMFIPAADPGTNRWHPMTDILMGDADSFSASALSVLGEASGVTLRTIYRFGGLNLSTLDTTDKLRFLGAFGGGSTAAHHVEFAVEPQNVYADNEDFATVELTVFDIYNDKLADTTIWLSQKAPGRINADYVTAAAGWEPIQRPPVSPPILSSGGIVTDANGVAKFEVRSTLAGEALFAVESDFGMPIEITDGPLAVDFIPKIQSVSPTQGVQGDTVSTTLEILGLDMRSYSIDSQDIHFDVDKGPSLSGANIVKIVDADDSSSTTFSITPQNAKYPVTVEAVITGDTEGTFENGQRTQIDELDSKGAVDYIYYAGGQPGISTVTFTMFGTSSASSKLYVIENDTDAKFYDLDLELLYGNPNFAPGDTASLIASFKFNGVPQAGAQVNFLATDDSVFDPQSGSTGSDGILASDMNVSDRLGTTAIVAYTIYNGHLFFDTLEINVGLVDELLTVSGVSAASASTLTFTLDIGSQAALGFWQVTASVGGWIGIEMPGMEDFEVLPSSGPNVARLVSISPSRAQRGSTLTVAIEGERTNFLQGYSMPMFKPSPLAPDDIGEPNGIKVLEDSVQVQNSTRLSATIRITGNATPGWWDVEVHTVVGDESETAVKYGDQDFMVTVGHSGYFIDLVSDRYFLPADGIATATETATVARLNEDTGLIVQRFAGQLVSFVSTDVPDTMDPATSNTDVNGQTTSLYTVDTIPGPVTITASTSLDTGTALGTLDLQIDIGLYKTSDHNLQFYITASPTTIDLNSPQRISIITVTLLNEDDSPLGHVQEVELSLDGGGSLFDSTPLVGVDGTATTTYLADTLAGTTTINGYAVVAGIGPITAEPAAITKSHGVGVKITLNLIVPIEGNRYEYETTPSVQVVVIGQNESAPLINNLFTIDEADKVVGLPTISVISGRSYDVWVKGKYHLAIVKSFTAPSQAGAVVTRTFTTKEGGPALIGDLIDLVGSFNFINAQDWQRFLLDYLTGGVADLNGDGEVNSQDYVRYFQPNYLEMGDPKPSF